MIYVRPISIVVASATALLPIVVRSQDVKEAFSQTVELHRLQTTNETRNSGDRYEAVADIGVVHVNRKSNFRIGFQNPFSSPVVVAASQSSCSCMLTKPSSGTVPPNESIFVDAVFSPSTEFGPFATSVALQLQDERKNPVGYITIKIKGIVRDYIQFQQGAVVSLSVDSSRPESDIEPLVVVNYFSKADSAPTISDESNTVELRSAKKISGPLPEHAESAWEVRLGLTPKYQESIRKTQPARRMYLQCEPIFSQVDVQGEAHSRKLHLWITEKPFLRSRIHEIKLIRGMTSTAIDLFVLEPVDPSSIRLRLSQTNVEVPYTVTSSTPSWLRLSIDVRKWHEIVAKEDELVIEVESGRASLTIPVLNPQNVKE